MSSITLQTAEASPPAGNGIRHALTAAPWVMTSATHRDGLPVLDPHNDMETPVMLTLISGRWQRRGATRWRHGLGIMPSREGIWCSSGQGDEQCNTRGLWRWLGSFGGQNVRTRGHLYRGKAPNRDTEGL
jgi:hypothetical protein